MTGPALRVALTFDAEHPDRPWCPPGYDRRGSSTPSATACVRATFFVQGRWAEAQPDDRAPDRATTATWSATTRTTTRGCRCLHDDGVRERHARRPRGDPRGDRRGPPTLVPLPVRRRRTTTRGSSASCEELGYRNVHWHVEVEDWEPWRTGEDDRARRRATACARTATAPSCCSTRGRAATADAVGPRSSAALRASARRLVVDRRAGAACRDAPAGDPGGRRRRLEDATSRSCGATASVLGAARVRLGDLDQPAWMLQHQVEERHLVPVGGAIEEAARQAGLDPDGGPVADIGDVLPRRRRPARRRAPAPRVAAAATAGPTDRRCCATTRSRSCAPARTAPGAWAWCAATARTAPRVGPDGRDHPVPGRRADLRRLGRRRARSASLAAWHAVRSEDGRGPEDRAANGGPAHFGLRRARGS